MRRAVLVLLILGLTSAPIVTNAQQQLARIPILTYHRFDPLVAGETTVTVSAFENQMNLLEADGYQVVPLQGVVAILLGESPAPATAIAAITVDDGHRSVYSVLYPVIKRRRLPVTLFIYPSAISNSPSALTWDEIREMQASGLVDVQSHTYWHPNFSKERAHRTPEDYVQFVDSQLNKSREKLDAELGTHVDLLAWPYGIVDSELESAACRDGYEASFGFKGELAAVGQDRFAIHFWHLLSITTAQLHATMLSMRRCGKQSAAFVLRTLLSCSSIAATSV